MSFQQYPNLKIKYHIYGTLLVMLAVIISMLPSYLAMSLAAWFLNVDINAPGVPNSGLNSFDYIVLTIMLINFIASIALVIYFVCRYKNWSFKQGVCCLILGKGIPKHWLN